MSNSLNIYFSSKLSTAAQLVYNNYFSTRIYQVGKSIGLNIEVSLPQYIVRDEYSSEAIWQNNKEKIDAADCVISVIDNDGQGTMVEIFYWLYNTDKKIAILLTDKNERALSPMWNMLSPDIKDRILFLRYNYMDKLKIFEQDNPEMIENTELLTTVLNQLIDERFIQFLIF